MLWYAAPLTLQREILQSPMRKRWQDEEDDFVVCLIGLVFGRVAGRRTRLTGHRWELQSSSWVAEWLASTP